MFLEEIDGQRRTTSTSSETLRVLEDYKPLDVECAAMGLLLCQGIRERYPDWRHLADGDGGDENLKDYPIEENPELTIRSVVDNLMLYQEGWGVGRIKHSLTYSGGLSRSYVRTYAPATALRLRRLQPVHAAGRHRGRRRDSVRRADRLRRADALRAEGRDRAARRQGGDRARHAGLPEAALPARRHVGRRDAPASRPVGARLPPRVRAPVCLTPASYPAHARPARDRFVLERRGPRPQHDPWRHQGLIVEDERAADGGRARMATVFLTGRECPWRCAMCDLWRYTTVERHAARRDPRAGGGRARRRCAMSASPSPA